ncbi:hypothetical protein B7C42_08116 [Nocardia cerradoensis]|uniref:Uncharacterized protein n=1 Tax=Nocardia cerradoensis TaxID=85688 RepID=A0A231GTC5_9NOCA|nr:hypothetical protein B7C42_08116 [Nocardia cerradoensis]
MDAFVAAEDIEGDSAVTVRVVGLSVSGAFLRELGDGVGFGARGGRVVHACLASRVSGVTILMPENWS